MVGRAVINHPCAFAGVDELLLSAGEAVSRDGLDGGGGGDGLFPPVATTRGEVLSAYIAYVEQEEAACEAASATEGGGVRLDGGGGKNRGSRGGKGGVKGQATAEDVARQRRRRTLIAPCFNLFAGEEGCDRFRRRLRKLSGRRKTEEPYSAAAILRSARAEISDEVLRKAIGSATLVQDLKQPHEKAAKRAGPLQAAIY